VGIRTRPTGKAVGSDKLQGEGAGQQAKGDAQQL
jgi:uncharacterized protein YjbJ (UPF0337 family)